MDIVQNINHYIENTGYTLTELERICGFPKSSLRKWSENIPSISKVAKVAEVLNVSLDSLYYGKEKSPSADLSEDRQRLLEMYDLLSDMERGEILGELKQMTRGRSAQEDAG